MAVRRLQRNLTILAVGTAFAAMPAWAQQYSAKWGPHIDLEAKPGTNRSLGEADLFMPLAQNADTLLFASLRTRMDDQNAAEGNFGLGLRHMMDSGWNLGAYGYFDRRRTPADNHFNQITLGLEALSRNWDLRANAYLPQGRRSHVVSETAGGLTSAAIVGTTVQITTSGASLTEERSLSGFDAELGWRVPVFEWDASQQFRIFGGGYHFTGSGVPDVTGPRLRAELAFDAVPYLWDGSRFTLGAEWQEDEPRGSQGFLTARLRIPLQIFGKPAAQLTPMERRMADPVVRDVDIVSQSRTTSQPGSTELATQTGSGQTLVVIDSSSAYGTDLTNELTAAGANSTVILTGTFNTTATSTLQAGQTVMGAGTLTVRGASGRTATLTSSSATIAGTIGSAETVRTANNATVSGLSITNTVPTGTAGVGVEIVGNNVSVLNNTVTVTHSTGNNNAFALRVFGLSAVVSGNTLTAIGQTGGGASAVALRVVGGTTVTNNTLNALGADINIHTNLNSGTIDAGSTGNRLGASNTGTCVTDNGGSGFVGYTNAANCNAF